MSKPSAGAPATNTATTAAAANTATASPTVQNSGTGVMRGYDLPVYGFVPPPELTAGQGPRHRVAIVGGGLAGLTLACDLADRGVAAVLLDDDNTIGARGLASRGVCVARKSLEIFDRLGIYDRIRAKGSTWQKGRVMSGTEELFSFTLDDDDTTRQPPFINLQQYYTEWYLVDRIMALGGVDLRWQSKVTDVAPQDDHVLLTVATPDGTYKLAADWVVAADGARSPVRAALGLAPTIEGSEDKWCITDVRLPEGAFPLERWIWIEAPFNDNRGVWQHLLGDNVWRLDFQMAPDSDPAVVSDPAVATARLKRRLGDIPFELVWVGPWSYRKFVMDGFRQGRVLFIGDAAHLMNPFGARGGNSGIQDADNLGWKLALVLDGQAPETLLDSYDSERRAAAHHNIRTTHRSARFMMPDSPMADVFRQAALGLCRRFPFARAFINGGRLSDPFHYGDSSLTTSGGQAAPNPPITHADGRTGHLVDLMRGHRQFLALWWGDGTPPSSVSSLAADGVLQVMAVTTAPTPAHTTAQTNENTKDSAPCLIDPDGLLAQAFQAGPGDWILLRPDLHVAAHLAAGSDTDSALGRALPQALGRALRRALGHQDVQAAP